MLLRQISRRHVRALRDAHIAVVSDVRPPQPARHAKAGCMSTRVQNGATPTCRVPSGNSTDAAARVTTSVNCGEPPRRGPVRDRGWRDPVPLTLSPSRQEARGQRHAQLRSTLLHWGRKHPGRTELRGIGQKVPSIPLEPTRGQGYRLPAAAAGGAKDLTPASPAPPEAYSPPGEVEGPWTDTDLWGCRPLSAEFRLGWFRSPH